MKLLYLYINIASCLVPFVFSFHPKIPFYKRWKFAFPSIILTATIFILWDYYYTYLKVWGFNSSYLTGIFFYNLPLEEILFFICIPYSCLFTYYCFSVLLKREYLLRFEKVFTFSLMIFLAVLGSIYLRNLYTSVTFFSLLLLLMYLKFIVQVNWLHRFYFTFLILLIPFCIVNGILTGTGIEQPVVWYDHSQIIGIRLLTIPIEDVFYGMLLQLLNIAFYEYFSRKKND